MGIAVLDFCGRQCATAEISAAQTVIRRQINTQSVLMKLTQILLTYYGRPVCGADPRIFKDTNVGACIMSVVFARWLQHQSPSTRAIKRHNYRIP